jgi:formylglycine-generating enzyme required for sulfatase activity
MSTPGAQIKAAARTCPKCGADLTNDAPEGLCPKCLLAQGLKGDDPPVFSPQADPNATIRSPNPVLPPPPPTIQGYSIVREISRGGQAVVYEGIKQSTGGKVAIKVLHGGAFIGPKEIARFDREVQVLAALNHPNIVQVTDRGTTTDGSHFLVMPYIYGRPLDKWLHAYYEKHRSGPPPEDPSELLRLFMKICAAVNAAHLQLVVHRDLKPSNILIDEHGEPRILDFGLARTAIGTITEGERVSLPGHFMGTLAYASPEHVEGIPEKIDPRSDVYSLGVILYQMLTGQFPYEVVGNMRDVLNRIMTAEPMPPSTVLAAKDAKERRKRLRRFRPQESPVNRTMDAIILKALAKRRDERYQSADEFARAIANYLAGRPPLPGEPPTFRRNVWLVTVGIAVACVCLVVSIVWVMKRPSPPVLREIVVQPTEPPRTETGTPAPSPTQVTPSAANKALVVDLGGGVKMEFVLIPAGSFMMGSENGTEKYGDNQKPVHKVTITKPYYLGKFEVTQQQWQTVMGSNPSKFIDPKKPVHDVSWDDCQEFVRKLKEKMPGYEFTLPTEAQWEYACRAGTSTEYSFGDREYDLREYAWFGGNSSATPQPVGLKKPNPWGLYDMHGNVMEWCADWYAPSYPSNTETDPIGPSSGAARVMRGGDFGNGPAVCRAAHRDEADPWRALDSHGLRIALAPSVARSAMDSKSNLTKDLVVDLGSGVKMELTLIPAGSFMMGSEKGGDNEKPVHKVTITKPFYLGKYEVTQAQWQALMGNNPSKFIGPKNPVDSVSWEDCHEFVQKLTEKVPTYVFNLPTEAQWEYACRAGTTDEYSFGDDEQKLREYGWFFGNSHETTHPVGLKKPNPWGLYDMHGNVREMCGDWYAASYSSKTDADPSGPSSGTERVHRGGDWNSDPAGCRGTWRGQMNPWRLHDSIGLRAVAVAR